MTSHDTPFVYDDYMDVDMDQHSSKKMYNRGLIMSNDERDEIYNWASRLISNNMMTIKDNVMLRVLDERETVICPLVFKVRDRIEKKENMVSFKRETSVNDNLIVVPKNGFLHKHTDPNDLENDLFHIRFNVFISTGYDKSNEFNTYYNGQIVDTVECCYVLCRSGVDPHWTDINKTEYPRISLSFGYLLTAEHVDKLTKDKTVGTYLNNHPLQGNDWLSNVVLHSLLNLNDNTIEERGESGSCIFTVSNIIADCQCDYLVNYINNNHQLWKERDTSKYSGNNVVCKFLSLNELISLKINDSIQIDEFISQKVNKILKNLKSIRPDFKGNQDDGYTLRKINGGTKIHADGVDSKSGGFTKFVRCLSLIIVLNDDYDGGIFSFPNQGVKIKVKKGEAVIFPPYWTHPHAVTSVGEGQARYTINTWILEKFID